MASDWSLATDRNNYIPAEGMEAQGGVDSLVQSGRRVSKSELPSELAGSFTTMEHAEKDVFSGVWEQRDGSETRVAMRRIIFEYYSVDQNKVEKMIRRATVVWRAVNHPNVLQFIGYKVIRGVTYLVSPWCQQGDLKQYIANKEGITDVGKLNLLCDAARGVAYLHSLTPVIAHGNIKSRNVVVKDDLEAAVCDFGVSRIYLGDLSRLGRSPYNGRGLGEGGCFQAREILDGSTPTVSGDVHAFGGMILAVMSGQGPFWKKQSEPAIIRAMFFGESPNPQDHPQLAEADPLWGLLRECWSTDPAERPTMSTVVEQLQDALKRRLVTGS